MSGQRWDDMLEVLTPNHKTFAPLHGVRFHILWTSSSNVKIKSYTSKREAATLARLVKVLPWIPSTNCPRTIGAHPRIGDGFPQEIDWQWRGSHGQEKVGRVGRLEGATVLVMTDAIMSDP